MMNGIQDMRAIAGQLGFATLLTLFLAGLFVYVMTRNYRLMIAEEFQPDLIDGEKLLDRLNVTGRLTSTQTIVTDRRILQLHLGWLFSRRRVFAIAWVDVHSVMFRRSVAWLAILLAAITSGRINPAAFLLLLWGLESRVYAIVFETPFALMPWTHIRVASGNRGALSDFSRCYRRAHAIWVQMRCEKVPAISVSAPAATTNHETDFALGRRVWVFLLGIIACAFLQRFAEGQVSFDSMLFGPIYLAAPVAAARLNRRDGRWVALLGVVGILTVKFPSIGLWGILASKGGMPYIAEYFGVLLTFLIMSEAASAISRMGQPSLSAFATLLWIPYVFIHMPGAALDLGLIARATAAVGVASLAAILASSMVLDDSVETAPRK
jgi:hypothetical protein